MPPGDARTRVAALVALLWTTASPQPVHLLPYPRSAAPRRRCILCRDGGVAIPFVLDDARFDAADVAHVAPRLPRYHGSGRETDRTRVELFRSFPGDHTPKPLPGERASNLATYPVPGSPEPASCKIMTSLTSQHMLQPKIALRGSRQSHATPSTESSASAYFSRNRRRTSSSAFHMPRPAASNSRARTLR